ncbi:MAG: hypothetical protein WC277_11300 [Bacilli bacterium]
MTPTVSRDGPGLLVSGLVGSPYGIGPGAARVLLLGRQCAEMLVPDEDGNGVPGGLAYATGDGHVRFRPGLALDHGVYEAPLRPLWRLFAGLDVFPVGLVEVRA